MDQKLNTLLRVSLDSIKDMIDVNTIIGDKIIIDEKVCIIPISKVKMGFISGGGDLGKNDSPPFTGGSGCTMGITPVGFIIVDDGIRFVKAGGNDYIENICELIIGLCSKIDSFIKNNK